MRKKETGSRCSETLFLSYWWLSLAGPLEFGCADQYRVTASPVAGVLKRQTVLWFMRSEQKTFEFPCQQIIASRLLELKLSLSGQFPVFVPVPTTPKVVPGGLARQHGRLLLQSLFVIPMSENVVTVDCRVDT